MQIDETHETGKLYFWKRTDDWDWFGSPRWWEVFVELSGFNGVGGLWLIEHWRWNGSSETLRREVRSTSYEDGQKILSEIVA